VNIILCYRALSEYLTPTLKNLLLVNKQIFCLKNWIINFDLFSLAPTLNLGVYDLSLFYVLQIMFIIFTLRSEFIYS